MRPLIGWILMLAVLFAQSAWAFEGHAGHFEDKGHHQQAPAHDEGDPDNQAPAASHCAHSPVHFVAVYRDSVTVAAIPVREELPPYRAPTASLYAEPPIQPPRG